MLSHIMYKSKSTKSDVDKQFEEFLKESVTSDDSMEKYFKPSYIAQEKQKESPWWLQEETETSGSSDVQQLGTGKSFLKKSGPANKERIGGGAKSPSQDSLDASRPPVKYYREEGSPTEDSSNFQPVAHHRGSKDAPVAPDLKLALNTTTSSAQDDVLENKTADEVPKKRDALNNRSSEMQGTFAGYGSGLSTMSSGAIYDPGRTGNTTDFNATGHDIQPAGTGEFTAGLRSPDASDKPRGRPTESSHGSSSDLQGSVPGPLRTDHSPVKQGAGGGPSMLSKVSLHDSCEDTTTTGALQMQPRGPMGDTSELGGHPHTEVTMGDSRGPMHTGLDSQAQMTFGGPGGDTTAADLSALRAAYAAVGGAGTLVGVGSMSSAGMQPGGSSSGHGDLHGVLSNGSPQDVARPASIPHSDVESAVDSTTRSFGMRVVVGEAEEQHNGFLVSDDAHSTPPPVPTPRIHRDKGFPKQESAILVRADKRYSNVKSSGYGRSSGPSPSSKAKLEDQQQQQKKKGDTYNANRKAISARPKSGEARSSDRTSRQPQRPASTSGLLGVSRNSSADNASRGTPNRQQERDLSAAVAAQARELLGPEAQSKGHVPAGTGGDSMRYAQLEDELKEWQNQWKEERKQVAKLKSDGLLLEREFRKQLETQKMEHDQKVYRLQHEVSRLQSRLEEKVSLVDKKLPHDVSKEDILKLEKEMAEQERLLAGYQKENERLYADMKKLQEGNKHSESHLIVENHRLQQEVTSARGELERRDMELRSRGLLTAGAISSFVGAASSGNAAEANAVRRQLESELREVRQDLEAAIKKIRELETAKQRAEAKVDRLTSERLELASRMEKERDVVSVEVEKRQEKHTAELEDLRRKLRWYMENQVLLEKDGQKLKDKEQKISDLSAQLEKVHTNRISESVRAKERSMDVQRIKMLENQILTLQQTTSGGNKSNQIQEFLETRIRELEVQIEERREDSDRALRGLEQRYYKMKSQYEARIHELETDLMGDPIKADSRVVCLRKEIESMQTVAKEKDRAIDRLRKELKQARAPPVKKKANETRVDSLMREVRERDLEIDRLNLLVDQVSRNAGQERPLDQTYKPDTFMGRPVGEIHAENEKLKLEVSHLRTEADRSRTALHTLSSDRDALTTRTKTEYESLLSAEREQHEAELRRIKTEYAHQHSQSRIAELQAKTSTQEVVISHLKEQLATNAVDSRALSALRMTEQETRERAGKLASELAEARAFQTPQMSQLNRLKARIATLEEKETQRERTLEQYVEKRVALAQADVEAEVTKWRRLVEVKSNNLTLVREELDRVLGALEELQRQGVVLPVKLDKLANIHRRLIDQ